MKAADIMAKEVVAVRPEDSTREVALLMVERRISGVPVVDAEGRVLGVVSEGDFLRRPELDTDRPSSGWLSFFLSEEDRARGFVKSHGLKARDVMTRPAVCVAPEAPLAEVVRLMERGKVKRLPVVADGKLVGIVTRADLLRAFAMQPASPPVASTDQELRDRIAALLRDQDWTASAMVNVEVEAGVVSIWGTVESAAQRDALMLAVRGVPGVKEVVPHLGRTMAG
ncbi:MAG: CBS domain-containing protein [Burkholderiales bacterium]